MTKSPLIAVVLLACSIRAFAQAPSTTPNKPDTRDDKIVAAYAICMKHTVKVGFGVKWAPGFEGCADVVKRYADTAQARREKEALSQDKADKDFIESATKP